VTAASSPAPAATVADVGRVAWIGVGTLATPIVRRLVAAGLRPVLHDPRPAGTAPFADAADVAATASGAAAGADLVFATLPSDAALEAVATAVFPAMRADAVFCDLSTVSPDASARAAALSGGRPYLRAPVSGSVSHAEQGILTVLASGPAEAFERCLPVLSLFSARRLYVGAAEEARVLKLAINSMVGSTAALLAESLTLALKASIDRETALDAIAASAVASPLVAYKVGALKARDYAPAFTAALMAKDMTLVVEAARSLGAPAPLAERTLELLDRLDGAGGAGLDFVALAELFAADAGLPSRFAAGGDACRT
jgi:3-hydroxyisobutyrate dehydrogenase-like beta-hydroxyacid dehydrogenase